MKLTPAEEWANILFGKLPTEYKIHPIEQINRSAEEGLIRQIQADALRAVIKHASDSSKPAIVLNVSRFIKELEYEANQLHPLREENKKT